jgi:hypothetical protein
MVKTQAAKNSFGDIFLKNYKNHLALVFTPGSG